MTEYVVLSRDGGGPWEEKMRAQARSARSAIRSFLDGTHTEQHDQYVAVPARSWQPVEVSVETKTLLRFS